MLKKVESSQDQIDCDLQIILCTVWIQPDTHMGLQIP